MRLKLLLLLTFVGCVHGRKPPEPTPLAVVPAAQFIFGSTEPCFPGDKPKAKCDSQSWSGMPQVYPTMLVKTRPFGIEIHEVTNAQYEYCVEMGACEEPTAYNVGNELNYYGNEAYKDYPVVNVTPEMAEAYCKFIGRRLPTEFEWELVAGGLVEEASNKRLYPYQSQTGHISDCQNKDINLNYCNGTNLPRKVATSKDDFVEINGQKVYDLMGNVAEWVYGRFRDKITCKEDLFVKEPGDQYEACIDCFLCEDEACKQTCYLPERCPKCYENPDCFKMCDQDPSVFPGIPRCISYGKEVLDAKSLVVETGPEALAKGGAFNDGPQLTCKARVADRSRHLTVSAETKFYNIGFRCAKDL